MTSPDIYDADYFSSIRGAETGVGLSPLYGRFVELVSDLLPSSPRILDVGCGRGDLLVRLVREGAGDLHGFDFAPAAVAAAKQNLGTLLPDGDERIRLGSITDPGLYEAGSFDIAFMTDVVEHLPPDLLLQGLGNVGQWLRPGGRLVIHTFPTLGPHRLFRLFLGLSGRGEERDLIDRIHCNVQTRATLARVVAKAGFGDMRLWLLNDFTLTSSQFNAMRAGPLKTLIRRVADDALNRPGVRTLVASLGLAEFAAMSIYCICTPTRRD
jgi:SAM-dependent methyltransferase